VHHRGDEGFVVLQGRIEVTRGDEVEQLSAGEFVIVGAGTPHTFATVDNEPATVLVTMTPEIDELVRALHEVAPEEREAVWGRYHSSPL
jgi:mannose-6-phosphate isomerase-like protein (cupin superfamily)